jgi:putative restriction endonuclease
LKAFVGVTDGDWFGMLAGIAGIDEVNFWQPGGNRPFKALAPGELFLFKLHSPHNFVVGGGVFAHSTLLPVSLAWEAFGEKNGARTLEEMRRRIEKYRRGPVDRAEDYTIGCTLLEQPFFFPQEAWIPVPADWKSNIVQGRTYDLTVQPGARLWQAVQERLQQSPVKPMGISESDESTRFGLPVLVKPRLGQGSFRLMVTDAYERRCAVTRERTLPVLQAAHIVPYSAGGTHDVSNGLLLRSDLHALFDRGYVTVDPDLHFLVSRRIKEEFENGRDYYALHGREMNAPQEPAFRPRPDHLGWHNEEVFLG